MRKHKQQIINTFWERFVRSISLFGCCLFFLLPVHSASAQDSAINKKVAQTFTHAYDSIPAVYKNADYYKKIPVAQKQDTFTAASILQSYIKLDSNYQSPDFYYKEDKVNRFSWLDRLEQWIDNWLQRFFPKWHLDLRKTFIYTLIGIGLLALIYIIYRLISSGKRPGFREDNRGIENQPDWMEKKLTKINLETYLEQALADKDYMLAIRYLHLINLKKLTAAGQIEWHYQKTHHEFLLELKNTDLKADFAKTIRVYEYIWYGRFDIDENKFREYQQLFHHFNQQIA